MKKAKRAIGWIFLFMSGCPFLVYADPISIVCTNSILADIASRLCGPHAEVRALVPVGGDPHTYEPTPSDVRAVTQADLIVLNGLHLENWLKKIIVNSGYTGVWLEASTGIQPIRSATVSGSVDPHAWMSPRLVRTYAANIAEQLWEMLPDKVTELRSLLNTYLAELDLLDAEIRNDLRAIPAESRLLITSHDAFRYYGEEYGIRVEPLMGISTEADLQIRDILRISRLLRVYPVKALFAETTINPKIMAQIAKDNGVVMAPSLFADSLGDRDTEAGTYIGMLRYNTRIIASCLQGREPCVSHASAGSDMPERWLYGGIIAAMLGAFVLVCLQLNLRRRSH